MGEPDVPLKDASDMQSAIASLPQQLEEGYAQARAELADVDLGRAAAGGARPTGVVVCGMGGSAIGADVVLACVPALAVPAVVVRGYDLPAWVDSGTLVVAVSYSGDTEETLSCLQAALERGCAPLCVASGGALAALAVERGLPLVRVSGGLQPRAALGRLAVPLAAALERAGLTEGFSAQVHEAAALVRGMAADFASDVPEELNQAKAIAARLRDHMVLVYGAGLTVPAARRWKTQINENAKAPAAYAELPELDHNEVVGWTAAPELSRRLRVVQLEDEHMPPRVQRRFHLTLAEVEAHAGGVERIVTHGASPLARVLSVLYLGDWVSYYLAGLYGVDPTPVEAIQHMKRLLAVGDGDG
jgi:glucose/mannose-6-phosphate isomerase